MKINIIKNVYNFSEMYKILKILLLITIAWLT